MPTPAEQVRLAFQPLYSLYSGTVVAVEALVHPGSGWVQDLLAVAADPVRMAEADLDLAVRAVGAAARQVGGVPLQLNLTASTAAAPAGAFDALMQALDRAGRRPGDVVLEITSPLAAPNPDVLLEGMHRLHDLGFQLAFDRLGAAGLPMNLLAEAPIEMVKLDHATLRRLPANASAVALVEALVHFARQAGLRLVATGVEDETELDIARRAGIRIVQGNLFATTAPARLLPATARDSQPGTMVVSPAAGLRIPEFLRQARTLPDDATCDDVHTILSAEHAPKAIIGLDRQARPQWTIDRMRFLLAVTGRYGHALYAGKPAAKLAGAPRLVRIDTGTRELLELIADAGWDHSGDHLVVIDASGRYQGVVRPNEVMRRMAAVKVEAAVALNPLTRLPGSDAVAQDVARRTGEGRPFVVAWLDIDDFKRLNDTAGFAAGDDLIRALGRALTDHARHLGDVTVGHVGGDDFLVVCGVEDITTLADAILGHDWSADGLPVTLSMASLVWPGSAAGSYRDSARLLAPLKKQAKDIPGSSWVNSWPGADRAQVLRGAREPEGRPRALLTQR
ncbi:bifunctional diguanylate cyclase/phosphodiesterase [Amycolatopsis jejuensis]|uniref:bifunctional diguanylate cyclase/phosphodiesterase n=1 Tax=Amycolatopsis jejuensis TaxID=330084 RepID=UPI000524F5FA|nr:bifunctional diguanylate cyclase/phosphodiesterase [Amycolatopsis jejuensis]